MPYGLRRPGLIPELNHAIGSLAKQERIVLVLRNELVAVGSFSSGMGTGELRRPEKFTEALRGNAWKGSKGYSGVL